MDQITSFLRQHLHDIATAMIATLLVVFGNDVEGFVKRLIKKNHFIVRLCIFILVCAIGYGLFSIFLADVLLALLRSIPKQFLALSVLAIFVPLALVAESRKQM